MKNSYEFMAKRTAKVSLCRLVSLNPESCHSHEEEAVSYRSGVRRLNCYAACFFVMDVMDFAA